MPGVRRSACAWGDYGFTAGVILIAAWLSLPAGAQLITTYPPDATLQPNLEIGTTRLPPISANLSTSVTTKSSNLTTKGSPPTAVALPATTAARPEVTSSVSSSKGRGTSMNVPVTDELSTHPGITTGINGTEWAPGGGYDEYDFELTIEFFVVIIVTVLVIVAVMIIVAALVFFCCHRRAETPTRFVKFKKRKPKHKYDKMDMEMSTLPRKHEPGGGSWIFSAPAAGDDHDDSGSMDLNLSPGPHTVTNENYDPGANGTVETAPSISDYHSEGNHATLELEDDDNDLNVNPMYNHSNRGSNKDSGIHGNGSDVGPFGDGETSIRSDTDLQSFADDSVEL